MRCTVVLAQPFPISYTRMAEVVVGPPRLQEHPAVLGGNSTLEYSENQCKSRTLHVTQLTKAPGPSRFLHTKYVDR